VTASTTQRPLRDTGDEQLIGMSRDVDPADVAPRVEERSPPESDRAVRAAR